LDVSLAIGRGVSGPSCYRERSFVDDHKGGIECVDFVSAAAKV